MDCGLRTGFTLVELLVVIVIIGVLASALIVMMGGIVDSSRRKKTKAIVEAVAGACQTYYGIYNAYPPAGAGIDNTQSLHMALGRTGYKAISYSKTGVAQQVEEVKPVLQFQLDWLREGLTTSDPEVTQSDIYDAFGEKMRYRNNHAGNLDGKTPPAAGKNKRGVDVWSMGSDKADGTEDDIGNWAAP